MNESPASWGLLSVIRIFRSDGTGLSTTITGGNVSAFTHSNASGNSQSAVPNVGGPKDVVPEILIQVLIVSAVRQFSPCLIFTFHVSFETQLPELPACGIELGDGDCVVELPGTT